MKLRLLALFLAFLTVCSAAAGCAPNNQTEPTASTAPTQTTIPTPPPETTAPTQPPAPEPEDLFSLCGQPLLPAGSSLPAYAQPTDTPFLYRCDLSASLASGHASVNADVLHIYNWTGSGTCSLYDLSDGKLIRQVELAPFFSWGELDDGGLWAMKYPSLQVSLYDSQGGEKVIDTRAEALSEENMLQNALISRDGRFLVTVYRSGDLLEVYDLQTGQLKTVSLPETLHAGSVEEYMDGFLISDFSWCAYFLDPETGAMEPFDSAQKQDSFYNGLYTSPHDSGLVLTTADPDAERFYMELSGSEYLCDVNFGCAVTQFYGDGTTLRFYDLRQKCFLGELAPADPGARLQADLLSDGTVWITCQIADRADFFLYDLPALAAQTQGSPVSAICATEQMLIQTTDALAGQIKDATGVELFYGPDGNDFRMLDFLAYPLLDPFSTYCAVKEVGNLLIRYPEGMLRETVSLTHKGLRIYLCGELYGISDATIPKALGVTSQVDGYLVIALNGTEDMQRSLSHELSHAFDHRIEYLDAHEGTGWMALWESLATVPDPYLLSYLDHTWQTQYTPNGPEEEIWFIDTYSRTFPTEDRARILEHLCNADQEASAALFDHENILYKARVYAYILRQCFPSCNTDAVHFWETLLGPIDASVLPESANPG